MSGTFAWNNPFAVPAPVRTPPQQQGIPAGLAFTPGNQVGIPPAQPARDPRIPTPIRVPAAVDPRQPQGYPPFQGFDECLEALRTMFRGQTLVSRGTINQHPPFRSRRFTIVQRVLLNIPVAIDPDANEGGNNLADAEERISGPGTVDRFDVAVGQSQTFNELVSQGGYTTIVDGYGVTVQNGRPEAIRVVPFIQGGPSTGTTGPEPLLSGSGVDDHEPTQIILPEERRILFQATNLDPCSATLFNFTLTGYVVPTGAYNDTQESIEHPKRGYSVDCVRSAPACEQ